VFTALNNALTPLGIRVTNSGKDQWSISDGRSLTRFHDGVVRASAHIAFIRVAPSSSGLLRIPLSS
jgi:hypothetical protein